MGRVSTWMGDRLGIRGAVFIFSFLQTSFPVQLFFKGGQSPGHTIKKTMRDKQTTFNQTKYVFMFIEDIE